MLTPIKLADRRQQVGEGEILLHFALALAVGASDLAHGAAFEGERRERLIIPVSSSASSRARFSVRDISRLGVGKSFADIATDIGKAACLALDDAGSIMYRRPATISNPVLLGRTIKGVRMPFSPERWAGHWRR